MQCVRCGFYLLVCDFVALEQDSSAGQALRFGFPASVLTAGHWPIIQHHLTFRDESRRVKQFSWIILYKLKIELGRSCRTTAEGL
jgi:hypothetical protein